MVASESYFMAIHYSQIICPKTEEKWYIFFYTSFVKCHNCLWLERSRIWFSKPTHYLTIYEASCLNFLFNSSLTVIDKCITNPFCLLILLMRHTTAVSINTLNYNEILHLLWISKVHLLSNKLFSLQCNAIQNVKFYFYDEHLNIIKTKDNIKTA